MHALRIHTHAHAHTHVYTCTPSIMWDQMGIYACLKGAILAYSNHTGAHSQVCDMQHACASVGIYSWSTFRYKSYYWDSFLVDFSLQELERFLLRNFYVLVHQSNQRTRARLTPTHAATESKAHMAAPPITQATLLCTNKTGFCPAR